MGDNSIFAAKVTKGERIVGEDGERGGETEEGEDEGGDDDF
jgi:hypothetical protein